MWTAEMKAELKVIFDAAVAKAGVCTREEILVIATRCGENPDDLEDQIDLLEFDEETLLLCWADFFEWWSEEVDPRDYDEEPAS